MDLSLLGNVDNGTEMNIFWSRAYSNLKKFQANPKLFVCRSWQTASHLTCCSLNTISLMKKVFYQTESVTIYFNIGLRWLSFPFLYLILASFLRSILSGGLNVQMAFSKYFQIVLFIKESSLTMVCSFSVNMAKVAFYENKIM